MRVSPRLRRLRSDHRAMEQLRAESPILEFTTPGPLVAGAPEVYCVAFDGPGLCKPSEHKGVLIQQRHEVIIRLGASYPRTMPELIWKTPIFHPNISAVGVVCLGGYSTHWVPSLQLDQLCVMLWDMIRYANYDIESPYNREAAQWVREQCRYRLPLDQRPLRDARRVASGIASGTTASPAESASQPGANPSLQEPPVEAEIVFVDDEIIDAEIVPERGNQRDGAEILFLD